MSDISSVMTANPASCRDDTPLRDVAQMMIDHDCGQIPVVDADNKPVGVVTDRDIAVRIVADRQGPRQRDRGRRDELAVQVGRQRHQPATPAPA